MKISNFLITSGKIDKKILNFLRIKFCFPGRFRLWSHYIRNVWYFRGSDETLSANNPTLETREKDSDNKESENELSDWIVPPIANHLVNLRLYNRRPNVLAVADIIIRTPVLYKLKKEKCLTDGEKSSLVTSLFDDCVKYTLWVSYYVFPLFLLLFQRSFLDYETQICFIK